MVRAPVNPGAKVQILNWPEVEERIRNGATGLLPVAAASKEHGFHLPMNTDQIQIDWLIEYFIRTCNVLVWPVLTYGYYPAFVNYPGDCSLSRDTFCSVLSDILHSIMNTDINRLIIINAGISTIEPLQRVIRTFPDSSRITLSNIYEGHHFKSAVKEVEEQESGQHADEIETSIMLAIAPERVDMSRAEKGLENFQGGVLNREDPQLPNYSPNGVIGNPGLASVEKGRKLTQAILDDLAELI